MQEVMGLCMEKARKLPTSAQHLKTEGNAKKNPFASYVYSTSLRGLTANIMLPWLSSRSRLWHVLTVAYVLVQNLEAPLVCLW